MAENTVEFIKVETPAGAQQTMPVEPEKRMADSDISVSLCDEYDIDRIAEGLYTCFPESWWIKKEPLEQRPPEQITRQNRLAARLRPSFSIPKMNWVKATLTSSGEVIGIAGWMGPGNPIHNFWRKSAADFYGWREKYGWSDEEFEEMWKCAAPDWDEQMAKDDGLRKELLGDEPHWYLAPLLTWPEYQGRGVGKKLMDWAIEQADATDPVTPLYLESAPTAKPVYMHLGFVEQSAGYNFLRRGPATAKELNAKGENKSADVKVVEKESAAELACYTGKGMPTPS